MNVNSTFVRRAPTLPLACLLLILAMLAVVLLQGRWVIAAMVAVLVAPAVFVLRQRARLPAAYVALFMLTLLVTAAAYFVNAFGRWPAADKVVHFYSGFSVTLIFGLLLFQPLLAAFARRRVVFVIAMTSVGALIAALWEVAEWLSDRFLGTDFVHGATDTVIDLVMGMAGGLLAALLALRDLKSR